MENKTTDILVEVADYYSAKLAEHGETPRGVDWNGEGSQVLRFEQLTRLIPQPAGFSLNDLGCGYGALFDYLNLHYRDFAYNGSDVSADMVRAAQDRHANRLNACFAVAAEPPEMADYGIASGIFNVRLGRSEAEWYGYLEATLDVLDRTSRLGFAFNCLTSYSDADKMRDYLYYADPCVLFDLCKRRYSRHVALLHDYGLYEFTILVKKNP
ncbi:class I SAM-dependent methyltransferase [Collimonas sp.]|jgi:SAM-dependent methyltransferase|uniref:class I SAM-dependent methyltransferase n=1 Tax=Collimonas sp. TaxID=1963772 RepID=UPI002BEF98E1|nr:class I SAM-dependent methyltransferase [Collimonas sp.]HWW04939.1 class I SAM-dependent methyltransferase [Collimonas sp.]